MTLQDAARDVGTPEAISPLPRLELVAQLARRNISDDVLRTVAQPLVDPGLQQEEDYLGELVKRLRRSTAGDDPLSRNPDEVGNLGRDPLVDAMVPEVQQAALAIRPLCEAHTVDAGGRTALALQTTLTTARPLATLRAMADPRQWVRMPSTSRFFRRMDMVRPAVPPPTPLDPPPVGWRARLREVVDFSFGYSHAGSALMTTDLDFTYVESETAVECTFDLGESQDGRILVDRGYVLIEDVEDFRRVTTLKQVRFSRRPQPGDVCEFWTLAEAAATTPSLDEVAEASGSEPTSDPRPTPRAGDGDDDTPERWEVLLDDVRDCWVTNVTRVFDRTRDNITLAREGRYDVNTWLKDVTEFWKGVADETSNAVGRFRERTER